MAGVRAINMAARRLLLAARPALLRAQGDAPRRAGNLLLLEAAAAARGFSSSAREDGLPEHIKFRMPDLDFREIAGGKEGATLAKWHVREGQEVKDGAKMCEIDTPDLNFVLEAGDEGFVARILVQEGASHLTASLPLAVIVPDEKDVEPFLAALRAQPHAIEGYVEAAEAQVEGESESEGSATAPTTGQAAGSDVLRVLHKLQKEGRFEDEALLKVLKSLARKDDPELLNTFRGSFEDGVMEEAAFDKDFFVDNALELAEEAAKQAAAEPKVEPKVEPKDEPKAE